MTDLRQTQLVDWLKTQINTLPESIRLISGDASFRRYFRLFYTDRTLIAVDAPPRQENCHPFVAIANALKKQSILAPTVYFVDYEQGFMVLSDLGDVQLLDLLTIDTVDDYYSRALTNLLALQSVTTFENYQLPTYHNSLLMQEMQLFSDWFLTRHLKYRSSVKQISSISTLFEELTERASAQPQVTVHRDYHSRNIMQTAEGKLAMIDFQDAVKGPICYDLISLVKDSYIRWPQHKIDQWYQYYYQLQQQLRSDLPSLDEFVFWADSMAIQRHLKVAGVFSRLCYRDNKDHYLKDIPQTLEYVVQAGERHQQYRWLGQWIKDELMEYLQK